jgi:hypothetical protein
MNLTDQEILELNQLCAVLVDGTVTMNQKSRLSELLAGSEEARRFYVCAMGLSASLFSYASELQTERADAPAAQEKPFQSWWRRWQKFFLGFGTLAAACVAAMVWINRPKPDATVAVLQPDDLVAQLTGAKECQWAGQDFSVQPGERLHKGQRLELARGFAEITFDSGAQIVLQGPASFDVQSAWAATLNHGTLKASIPPEAMGFSISNPKVEVVDMGTEFTMFADAIGAATEVLVLKGEVEAQPSAAANQQPIVLREQEARRFAASGVSPVPDREKIIAEFSQPMTLDHFIPPTDYLHWSFNEANGGVFQADASGKPFSAADFRLEGVQPEDLPAAHGTGKWDHALQFDGHFFAKATLPDISENTPHTVAFWVKVPKDTSLFNAYAMVAWGVNSKLFGSHPVHIGWNRNPNEGTIGVLRTDFGGGFALGSTPLRDGHWHHVAVVLIPGEDGKTAMQVKQYIDGRLEGESKPSPPGSEIFTKLSNATSGALWLGCRIGLNGVRQERFRGSMDELFMADRALEPVEIVGLMQNNKLPPSALVVARQ